MKTSYNIENATKCNKNLRSGIPFLYIIRNGHRFKRFCIVRPRYIESEVVRSGGQNPGHKADKLLILTVWVVNHKGIVVKIVHFNLKK